MARGYHSTGQNPIRQVIKRGILTSFDPSTYTAGVMIMESTSTFLSGVPMACHMDGTSAQENAYCAVLFFDEQNVSDAVVIAVYANGSQGVPSPAPGRVVFVTGFRQINAQTINLGSTSTFTLTGSGGIPTGALGVIYKAFLTSPTSGAYINLAPHGASDVTAFATIGNLPAANAFLNGCGILQLDSAGNIDINANVGNCTVTLFTHGYVF
jgi:hypothetical protein